MNKKLVQVDKVRRATQNLLRQFYPEQLAANQEELCPRCRYQKDCKLVPVTTLGEDCPYYVDKESAL